MYTDSSTQTEMDTIVSAGIEKGLENADKESSIHPKSIGDQNLSVEPNKQNSEKENTGWNINANDEKSIADQVKEVAQSALQQTGMVYVESAGMYYDYKTGYYYNSVS